MPSPINSDTLNHVSSHEVIQAALQQLDRTSGRGKEVQAVAFGVTMLVYARRYGIDVGQIFTVANNILHSKEGQEAHYQALREYMRHEL